MALEHVATAWRSTILLVLTVSLCPVAIFPSYPNLYHRGLSFSIYLSVSLTGCIYQKVGTMLVLPPTPCTKLKQIIELPSAFPYPLII